MKEKDNVLVFEGTVLDICRDKFRVRVNEKMIILAVPSGKIRKAGINILVGDNVVVECSVYSPELGRITYRSK